MKTSRLSPTRVFRATALALLMSLLMRAAQAQCSMCKTALSESIEGQIIAEGMNRAIILLVAVPLLAVACVGLLIWRSARRRQGSAGWQEAPPLRVEG